MLRPRFAVLDEIDSGLDVDALGAVGRRVEEATTEWGLGVLAITHFRRLLDVLHPDVVHVLSGRRVVATGDNELAEMVDRTGYAAYTRASVVGVPRRPGTGPGPPASGRRW